MILYETLLEMHCVNHTGAPGVRSFAGRSPSLNLGCSVVEGRKREWSAWTGQPVRPV
ncbi:hypothetical protein CALCODRAFT_274392 [Calocera cornea HHB12733]|uniref:Uncharacterized protein n=1 Tax=Calocera cornea HHB12733 TaxID=1353952 RepID=A0A165G4K6_9BASI|nr:hypothetical protein CALCODRAFT_274392 [Calocera cornea HHB12733]